MGASAEDLDLGHRDRHRSSGGEVGPQRQAGLGGRGVQGRERDGHRGVAAQPCLRGRPVEGDQAGIEGALVGGVGATQGRRDLLVDGGEGTTDVQSTEPRAAVATIDRLARATRSAGRRDAAADRPVGEVHRRDHQSERG